MKRIRVTSIITVLYICYAVVAHASPYQIAEHAPRFFANKDAKVLFLDYLTDHPSLKKKLLDPTFVESGTSWAYHSQTYRNKDVLSHLVALQVKAMAERGEIKSLNDIFDPKYGIGSKTHKDKGTINNPLSLWGHPVQTEVLGKKSRLNTLRVYHALRETIKNDLIRYGRNQSLAWHQMPAQHKLKDTISFLEKHHQEATQALRDRLKALSYDLDTLIRKVIETHLIS